MEAKEKAEEIYHRFVNYEWNEVGKGLEESILRAIEEALKQSDKCECKTVKQEKIESDYRKYIELNKNVTGYT